jgi:hypothetical protein
MRLGSFKKGGDYLESPLLLVLSGEPSFLACFHLRKRASTPKATSQYYTSRKRHAVGKSRHY